MGGRFLPRCTATTTHALLHSRKMSRQAESYKDTPEGGSGGGGRRGGAARLFNIETYEDGATLEGKIDFFHLQKRWGFILMPNGMSIQFNQFNTTGLGDDFKKSGLFLT